MSKLILGALLRVWGFEVRADVALFQRPWRPLLEFEAPSGFGRR